VVDSFGINFIPSSSVETPGFVNMMKSYSEGGTSTGGISSVLKKELCLYNNERFYPRSASLLVSDDLFASIKHSPILLVQEPACGVRRNMRKALLIYRWHFVIMG
jgi:hypothetical protein